MPLFHAIEFEPTSTKNQYLCSNFNLTHTDILVQGQKITISWIVQNRTQERKQQFLRTVCHL